MRTVNPTLRLEAHRLKWLHSDRKLPLLPFHELNEVERQFLVDELAKDATVRRLNVSDSTDERTFDGMMLNVLNEWGIMCPHPKASLELTSYGYYCDTCGCDIFPSRRKSKPINVVR